MEARGVWIFVAWDVGEMEWKANILRRVKALQARVKVDRCISRMITKCKKTHLKRKLGVKFYASKMLI